MSIDLRFEREKKFLIVTVKGPITIAEFQEVMERITKSQEYPPDINALWDLRELDMEVIDKNFWYDIIETRKKFPERGKARLAHIVSKDFEYGMLRMYEILSEGRKDENLQQNLMVFKSYSEGEKWLLDG